MRTPLSQPELDEYRKRCMQALTAAVRDGYPSDGRVTTILAELSALDTLRPFSGAAVDDTPPLISVTASDIAQELEQAEKLEAAHRAKGGKPYRRKEDQDQ